jgi:hypothetical protein
VKDAIQIVIQLVSMNVVYIAQVVPRLVHRVVMCVHKSVRVHALDALILVRRARPDAVRRVHLHVEHLAI